MPATVNNQPQPNQPACQGVVRELRDRRALIELEIAHCQTCHLQTRCPLESRLGRLLEADAAGLQLGDRVLIKLDSRTTQQASWLLFMLPFLLVLFGSFAGYSFAALYWPGHSELGSVGGVAAGLLAGYVYVHFCGRLGTRSSIRVERLD